jgi:phosphopantothenoylcysteine decarboxylase/phosphopantothenate--cysteine ligase
MDRTLEQRRLLLIISGGIAAYKTLDLIRRLKERGASVRAIMTKAAHEFVTPLSVGSLTGEKVHTQLWSLGDEAEMGHIRLSREADLIVVAPATADLMARMAVGLADDLATATLLAADKPVLLAPAMNVMMWAHPATADNLDTLRRRGSLQVGPNEGDLADGETGPGRMAEPLEIVAAIERFFQSASTLAGVRALVTSGPTFEPIDPVRFLGNRSSGKQGHAIAAALAARGAEVVLISGPTHEADPAGVSVRRIETARQMLAACTAALPVDVAVCAAAVADWRAADEAGHKLKKSGGAPPVLTLVENPDILATLSRPGPLRPRLVVGFAAETDRVVEHAKDKRARKGCDWILANDVSAGTGTFGGDRNTVHLVAAGSVEDWPDLSKIAVAEALADRIVAALA